jgi:hypothetical protein
VLNLDTSVLRVKDVGQQPKSSLAKKRYVGDAALFPGALLRRRCDTRCGAGVASNNLLRLPAPVDCIMEHCENPYWL